MDKHAYKQNAYYLIYLIRCVLHNRIPAKEKLDKMDLSGIFDVAKSHLLTAIAAYALESAGIYDRNFDEEKVKAIRKSILLDFEMEQVIAQLKKYRIWYMPLKGAVLKDLYPQIGMRQMADIDILFDQKRSNEVKEIMENLDFSTKQFGTSNHDVYYKYPVCNLEMHRTLFENWTGEIIYDYYGDINKRLIRKNNKTTEYYFSDEDFYIYITAHEYKHFVLGGIGIRSLVDRYLFLKKHSKTLNMSYIRKELSKMHIADYEKKCRILVLDLFNGKIINPTEKEYLDLYIFAGAYGTIDSHVNIKLGSKSTGVFNKFRYLFERFIEPIDWRYSKRYFFKKKHPIFYEYKILLPLLPIYRFLYVLINNRKKLISEIRIALKK